MSYGPFECGGYFDSAASASSGQCPFPAVVKANQPAWCIALDDLPPATGGPPPQSLPESAHEWNVARFRPVQFCTSDGAEGVAYVWMTSISASGA